MSYVVIERPALALKDRHHRLFAEWRPVGLPADARPREHRDHRDHRRSTHDPVAPPGADGDGGRTGVRAWPDRHGWVVPTVVVGLAVALPLRGVLRARAPPWRRGS